MTAGAAPATTLRLRIDRTTVAAADKAAVGAAVEAANARVRDPNLPDAFNPAVIDPAKADALLTALTNRPATRSCR